MCRALDGESSRAFNDQFFFVTMCDDDGPPAYDLFEIAIFSFPRSSFVNVYMTGTYVIVLI